MKNAFAFTVLCAAALMPAALFAQSAPLEKAAVNAAPTLSPGDIVRITVWRQEELSGEFQISSDGTILHPLFQQVRVAGVPLEEAVERLRQVLSRYETSPRFVLEPLFRVAVGGEVRQPSLYTLTPQTTIAQAVALAGGPTERGRLDRVRLLRDGEELVIDLTEPGAEFAQARIRSGDQIIVERRRAIFRDYIAPIASVAGALGVLINVILINTR